MRPRSTPLHPPPPLSQAREQQASHLSRIQHMRPMIDTRAPRSVQQSSTKRLIAQEGEPRREGARGGGGRKACVAWQGVPPSLRSPPSHPPPPERYAQIEHENRLLLSRMSEILIKPGGDNSYAQGARRGYSSRGEAPARPRSVSLHEPARRAEHARVQRANLSLLARLQATRPVLSASAWARDATANAVLVARISEFAASRSAGAEGARGAEGAEQTEAAGGSAPLPGFEAPANATAGELSWSWS